MENENGNEETEQQPAAVEEETVTLAEIARDIEEAEKQAELLFGAQDPSICTFPEGYKPRQTLFTCLTCTPEPQTAGVCYGCSLNCHDGHEIIELYTKRKFRCDCGNSKFPGKPCTLYEEKDATNEYNAYNQNFNGKFCNCHVFYPADTENREFLQCEVCEDWYHDNHITIKKIRLEELPTSSENVLVDTEEPTVSSLVCPECVKKLPFIQRIPIGKDPFCHSKLSTELLKIDDESVALEIEKFRERLCKCPECIRVYERADCDFLADDDDDIGTFEKEAKEKAQENKPKTDQQEMREIVQEIGMEGAQIFYSEVNNFKRKLSEFINNAGGNGNPVSEDDVKTFFANLNQDRIERKRARYGN